MSNERTVNLGGDLSHGDVIRQSGNEAQGVFAAHRIKESVPDFKRVRDYTTFDAEYTMIGPDLVFHFFVTSEMKRMNQTADGGPWVRAYWMEVFPQVIDAVAKDHFNAGKGRLVVKYTEELASWYFRARSYDHIIDVDAFASSFLEKLDRDLEQRGTQIGS